MERLRDQVEQVSGLKYVAHLSPNVSGASGMGWLVSKVIWCTLARALAPGVQRGQLVELDVCLTSDTGYMRHKSDVSMLKSDTWRARVSHPSIDTSLVCRTSRLRAIFV